MRIYLTFIICFVINFHLFPQNLIYPSIPADAITGLHYLNENEIIFINAGGSIYKSYDGGNTWQLKKYYMNSSLAEIQFIDDLNGFIRTQNYNLIPNKLIYTNDGGENWSEQVLSIYPVNSFLPVSQSILLKANQGNIQRLDNFYNNWETTFTCKTFIDSGSDYISIEPYGSIKKLSKLDGGELIALGTNENAYYHHILNDSLSYLLQSIDQGLTWDTLWIGSDQLMNDIEFVNDTVAWMVSDTALYKSIDGGLNWNFVNPGYDGTSYKSFFAKGNNVYLLTFYNTFLKSTDQGNTWSTKNNDLTYSLSIIFRDNDNGLLFGEGLYKTTNGGQSWQNFTPLVRDDIYDIDFISEKVGVALYYKWSFKNFGWRK